jgi:hypothetical protein
MKKKKTKLNIWRKNFKMKKLNKKMVAITPFLPGDISRYVPL